MIHKKIASLAVVGVLLPLMCAGAARAADSTIHVSLWDKVAESVVMDPMPMMGMGKGLSGGNMADATMGITLDLTEVPAGKVTFEITNDSNNMYHEMTISRVESPDAELPYSAEEFKVDETAFGVAGKAKELGLHKSGRLSVELTPGQYVLYCNIPGHFINGMWALLTVTP